MILKVNRPSQGGFSFPDKSLENEISVAISAIE